MDGASHRFIFASKSHRTLFGMEWSYQRMLSTRSRDGVGSIRNGRNSFPGRCGRPSKWRQRPPGMVLNHFRGFSATIRGFIIPSRLGLYPFSRCDHTFPGWAGTLSKESTQRPWMDIEGSNGVSRPFAQVRAGSAGRAESDPLRSSRGAPRGKSLERPG